MTITAAYPDLTTATPLVNTILLGDVDIGFEKLDVFLNKATGTGKSILRGKVLAKDNTVTPNIFRLALDADTGPVYVSATPQDFDYVNPTISAQEADPTVHAWSKCRVVLEADDAIQPGGAITMADAGKVKAAGGSDPVIGVYLYKKGSGGANVTKAATVQGDLIWCDFDGRVI